jgi:hypothetical protein
MGGADIFSQPENLLIKKSSPQIFIGPIKNYPKLPHLNPFIQFFEELMISPVP